MKFSSLKMSTIHSLLRNQYKISLVIPALISYWLWVGFVSGKLPALLFCTKLTYSQSMGPNESKQNQIQDNFGVKHPVWMNPSYITWAHGYFQRSKIPTLLTPKTFHGKFCARVEIAIREIPFERCSRFKSGEHLFGSSQNMYQHQVRMCTNYMPRGNIHFNCSHNFYQIKWYKKR